jgi:putative PIG3 family NAD(P)H quinone oxidoreductase
MFTLPTRMTAIAIRVPGGPEVLVPEERPMPVPATGEILVKVAAAGVNRPDAMQRMGLYPPPPGASDIPGLEIAGEVAALGDGVTRFERGAVVTALVAGGGYAEYCPVHESNALAVPPGLSLIEAGAIPETFFTVWHNVFERGGLQEGGSLLVHGGSSGIGLCAIQLAKAFGAMVITTVGNADKAAYCRDIGADHAINYRERDFTAEVAEITAKRGVDVVLDIVGGDYIEKNLKCLALEGRLVIIAFLHGSRAEVDWRFIMLKRLTVTGSTMRASPLERKAAIARTLHERVWPLFEAGTLKPVIYRVFPLQEAAAAHALMESSQHIGKIMLAVQPE